MERLAIAAALAISLLVRLRYVLSGGFPLHQGGLFYAMVRELQRSHYALPSFTAYNHLHIPFAYPPFALYLTAAIADLTHTDPLTIFRFLPLAANVATVGAFYLLARSLVRDRLVLLVATFAFALVPSGFVLLIEGGGLTRSFGFLFAVLALWQLQLLYTRRHSRHAVLASVFCGLMVLSHLEFAFLIATSVSLALVVRRDRYALGASLAVAAGTLLVVSPWLVPVALRHGLTPFMKSLNSGDSIPLRLYLLLGATSEFYLPVVASCALLGLLSARARRLRLVVWLVALYVVDSRGAKMYGSVPLALMAGFGVVDVIMPLIRRATGSLSHPAQAAPQSAARSGRISRPAFVLGGALALATVSALTVPPSYLSALSAEQRGAMHWVAQNTPPDARFIVLGGEGDERDPGWSWELDRSAEWFPALTGRTSVATYEGHEWLGDYGPVQRQFWKLLPCTVRDATCLDVWAREAGVDFAFVFVPKGPGAEQGSLDSRWCCWSLRNSLRTDPRYITLYDGPGASIFMRR